MHGLVWVCDHQLRSLRPGASLAGTFARQTGRVFVGPSLPECPWAPCIFLYEHVQSTMPCTCARRVYTHIQTYMHTYMNTYIHIFIQICIYIHTCIHAYVQPCIHACIHTRLMRSNMFRCIWYKYIYIYIYLFIYIYIYTHRFMFVPVSTVLTRIYLNIIAIHRPCRIFEYSTI